MAGIIFESNVDYAGRTFSNFHPRQYQIGVGWYVAGFAQNVSATVYREMARPDVPMRKTSRFNGAVKIGWKTKREAQSVADAMNALGQ